MRRGRRIALVGLLLLLAAAQVAVSLRQAVQLAPPPQLFSLPQDAASSSDAATAVEASPSSEAVAPVTSAPGSAQAVATPDPANILRITIREGGLSPLRMQAAAGKRLELMVTNDDRTARVLEVAGPAGVSVRSDGVAKGQQENVFIEPARGVYRVHVVGTDLEAELRVP